jgi:hypothetical protein
VPFLQGEVPAINGNGGNPGSEGPHP